MKNSGISKERLVLIIILLFLDICIAWIIIGEKEKKPEYRPETGLNEYYNVNLKNEIEDKLIPFNKQIQHEECTFEINGAYIDSEKQKMYMLIIIDAGRQLGEDDICLNNIFREIEIDYCKEYYDNYKYDINVKYSDVYYEIVDKNIHLYVGFYLPYSLTQYDRTDSLVIGYNGIDDWGNCNASGSLFSYSIMSKSRMYSVEDGYVIATDRYLYVDKTINVERLQVYMKDGEIL